MGFPRRRFHLDVCTLHSPIIIFLKSLTISDVQVPETKGLTLEEMDEVFGDSAGTALADQQRHADISRRLGLDRVGQDHGDVFNNDDKSSQKEKV